MTASSEAPRRSATASIGELAKRAFAAIGPFPIMLVILFIVFGLLSEEHRFWNGDNIFNIARQSTYLMIVTMGQMLYLLSRNYDLSNGSCVALTSIVTSLVMTWSGWGGNTAAAIAVGCLAGIGVGVGVGFVNGFVVSVFNISSFMVTLGMSFMAFGAALMLSSGTPVTGLPEAFVSGLGTGRVYEPVDGFALSHVFASVPVVIAVGLLIAFYVLLNWTRLGRHAYAIGGNVNAARLSGIGISRNTIYLFVIGSALAAIAGIMLTARISSGEANIGSELPLLSIAAAVLGGVSLFGGEGRLSGVVVGVVFIIVLQNGMQLLRLSSYLQLIVLGALLIVALIVDRLRARLQT
jgi:ribose/xylose/arabinose/galactoside ABC-type transport system permease subunit